MKQIPLTQGKFAIVDDDMFDYLSQWKWTAIFKGNTWYATRMSPRPFRKVIYMHRIVANSPEDTPVDHRDHNGLNNQDHNLRVCTSSQNSQNRIKPVSNTSGFKGVAWEKRREKWSSRIYVNRRQLYLGYFES